MNQDWLQGVYDDYRRGDPETVRGVRTLQRKVQVGCAAPRDVAVLKGLDQVHFGQDAGPDAEASIFVSDSLLRTLLDLIAQARRPPSVNLLTAGTSPMRRHGGATISGYYDNGPFFGAGAHGGGGGAAAARGGGGFSRGGAAARAASAPMMSAPAHAGTHGGSGHRPDGRRHAPGGGFASWVGPWGGWPGDCYLDVYGRIWCWGPYGWQVVA